MATKWNERPAMAATIPINSAQPMNPGSAVSRQLSTNCRKTNSSFAALASAVVAVQALWLCAAVERAAGTDVVVLANRTGNQIDVRFQPAAGAAEELTIAAGDVRPLFVDGGGQVEFNVPRATKRYLLDPNSAYFFGRDASGQLDLQKIGLGDEKLHLSGRRTNSIGAAPLATITVKILVDEEEPARQFAWEQRLRRRVEAASRIIEHHCHVQLKVLAVGTWDSDDATTDFFDSLNEFEREVDPSPARLAIGFTSQYQMIRGRTHMAGMRGPLSTHILVREGSPQIDEAERLEFLVHELGHFLGASHSPERFSVMRPVLGDNLAGRNGFQIRFDPVNTLVMAMIGEELRTGRVKKFIDLSTDTKRQLQAIYTSLAAVMPEDPSGVHFMQLAEAATNEPMVRGARRVVQSILRAAVLNQSLPAEPAEDDKGPARRRGDALCDYLVRQAAAAADTLPDDVAPAALLLGLAVGMDDSDELLNRLDTRSLAQAIESPSDRSVRQASLGDPTILGRRDMSRRFFIAAYLASNLDADSCAEDVSGRRTGEREARQLQLCPGGGRPGRHPLGRGRKSGR